MEFYRYENHEESTGTEIREYKFILLSETECGYWIIPESVHVNKFQVERYKKWISKTTRKRYAYPTKSEAKKNFIARKNRECLILMHRLKCARSSLRQLDIEPPQEHINLFSSDIDRDY